MTVKDINGIRKQAKLLASENKKVEPGIQGIYWFPHDNEVRLVGVEDNIARSLSGEVEPFFFEPSPVDNLHAPSGIALIRPDEYGKLDLPRGWGKWEDAVKMEVEA